MRTFKGSNKIFKLSDDGKVIHEAYSLIDHKQEVMQIITPLELSETLVENLQGLVALYGLKEVS